MFKISISKLQFKRLTNKKMLLFFVKNGIFRHKLYFIFLSKIIHITYQMQNLTTKLNFKVPKKSFWLLYFLEIKYM